MTSATANLAGAGAVVLWAFLAVLSRAAAAVPPLQLTAMGFGISAIVGLVVLGIAGRLGELRQSPSAWLHGVGGLFGYHSLYFAALALAPVAEANLINYTWPLLIVLFSAAILGLRLRPLHFVGVALGFAGSLLILARGAHFTSDDTLGYLLAAGCAIVWSLYSVLARRLSGVPTGAVAGFCAATAVLAGLIHGAVEATVMPDRTGWIAIVLLGFGPIGAAFFLWDIGMKRGDPRLLGTLAYATPVGSTLLLAAVGFTPLTTATVIAAALVALGGLIASRAQTTVTPDRADL